MKLKQAKCDCGYYGDSIKGKCRRCYWNDLRLKSAKKSVKKSKNDNLDKWFEVQITQIPNDCENCGGSLEYHKRVHPKWLIAHILPKRKNQFPKVATHPLNRLFLCPNCHQDFDNKGSDIVKMKCYNIAIKRLKKIILQLNEEDKSRLPEHYIKNLKGEKS